jgi:hypothetical protein
VLSTLVHWAKAACDPDSLPQELKFLHEKFRNNGYSERQILHAGNAPIRSPLPPHRKDNALLSVMEASHSQSGGMETGSQQEHDALQWAQFFSYFTPYPDPFSHVSCF